MSIPQDLLEMLICPACKGKVELQADGNSLKCLKCGRVYPIENSIPSMLIVEECPLCKKRVMMQGDGDNLVCPECAHRYGVLDGIA
jgi:uncharacterized protein YbaR (Trm112 family)